MNPIMLERVRREAIRWHLLKSCYIARPYGIYTEPLLSIIQGTYPDATHQEVRRELDYLDSREMVRIQRDPIDRWTVNLSRNGIDFCEYLLDAQPGIARPLITQG